MERALSTLHEVKCKRSIMPLSLDFPRGATEPSADAIQANAAVETALFNRAIVEFPTLAHRL